MILGQVVPRDLPTLSLPNIEATYTYNIEVNDDSKNPYVYKTELPENLVFIILGGVLLLIFLTVASVMMITWLISLYKAKTQSEKYYYNQPLVYEHQSSSSSNSSIFERKSNHSTSNLSQLTMNQVLKSKNRGSMFFSPTNDFVLDTNKSSSKVSLFDYNPSVFEWNNIDNNSLDRLDKKPSKRPPSQYLEDLLGDSTTD